MSFLRTLETGLRGILGHRLRSFLTTLGILIGVAAVIATIGIGRASADSVTARIAALGTNLLTITPGSNSVGGIFGGLGSASTLTMDDVSGLKSRDNAPDIQAVAPVVQTRRSLVSQSTNWTTTVQGSSAEWLVTNARTTSQGRFIEPADVASHAQVMVLGSTTAQELGASVGDTVTAGSAEFQVIGVLTSTGGQAFQNGDDLAVVPITTAQDELVGGSPNGVQRILLSATSADTVGSAYQEASDLLYQTHHITDPTQADFSITSQQSVLSTAAAVTNTLTLLLASIAAISLLVGGIGVMNIMLVSVTERTREIGLRKALGATPGDLLRQFLVEAATLSLVGGVAGIGVGLIIAAVLPRVASINVEISLLPVMVAVGVAAAVGLMFGVYPATRAARLAPIEALRAD